MAPSRGYWAGENLLSLMCSVSSLSYTLHKRQFPVFNDWHSFTFPCLENLLQQNNMLSA